MPTTTPTQAAPATAADSRVERALAGLAIYGDDFSADEIDQWFEDERQGYFDLYYGDTPPQDIAPTVYEYQALADRHNWRWLPQRQYRHALGIGSAHGAELLPVLERSGRVTVLEPSAGFASTEIQGKPVQYVQPQASGVMPFADAAFDLVICFSVLHHIPNVSTLIREMFRVVEPGGHVLLREPTHSMGDWRQPRRGLTRRERGVPLPVFRQVIDDAGFRVLRQTRCNFSPMSRLQKFTSKPIWTLPWVVRVDAALSCLPIWPSRYHAVRPWQKIRPTGVAFVLEKPR